LIYKQTFAAQSCVRTVNKWKRKTCSPNGQGKLKVRQAIRPDAVFWRVLPSIWSCSCVFAPRKSGNVQIQTHNRWPQELRQNQHKIRREKHIIEGIRKLNNNATRYKSTNKVVELSAKHFPHPFPPPSSWCLDRWLQYAQKMELKVHCKKSELCFSE